MDDNSVMPKEEQNFSYALSWFGQAGWEWVCWRLPGMLCRELSESALSSAGKAWECNEQDGLLVRNLGLV